MSRQPTHAVAVVAAVLVLAGLLIAVTPQHALSIVQVALVSLAVVAGLQALLANVGDRRADALWLSPFVQQTYRTESQAEPPALDRLRSSMGHRRRPGSAPLPPETGRHLSRMARAALARRGLDLTDPGHTRVARTLVSPLTWEVMSADASSAGRRPTRLLRADAVHVAELVHAVLDDLDRLESSENPTMRGAP